MPLHRRLLLALTAVCLAAFVASSASADQPGFSFEQDDKGVRVKVGDQPFAEYVINDPATNKTYLWPIYGPSGKSMTRAFPMKDIEGEVKDHYHHRGINFGHEDIGGFDSWTERMTFDIGEKTSTGSKARIAKLGQMKHRSFKELTVSPDKMVIVSELDYIGADGKKSLTEVRTLIFSVSNGQRLIDFDQVFIATEGDVTFGDKKDAGLSIRVPTPMSVDSKKGGKIVNSEGLTDAAAWGKRAKWCDYFGPVEGETLGVAILNHPSSFRHPTSWHVRTYGLFTANPFGTLDKESPNGPHTIKAGEKMELRHRFVLHTGDTEAAKINEAYERYVGKK